MRPGSDSDRPGFELLGDLRVRRAGADVVLGGPRQRSVLAALLLRPNAVVPVEELVAGLWGERPSGAPDVTLRTYVWRLRNLLEPVRDSPRVLLSQSGGYRLAVEADSVDLGRVGRLRERAAKCCAERPAEARDLLTEALAQWRGEPLTGLPGPLMHRERERLAHLRLALREERLALDVALDGPAGYLPELEALAADHPFRERLHGLLIRALLRQGRTSEARAVYDALRIRLVEHLGLEPGPELSALCHELDVGSPAGPTAAAAPGRSARLDRLPPPPDRFTGRQEHLTRIGQALTERTGPGLRLVTVTGMGGVGKTALAVRAAHTVCPSFPDGRLYADLRGADLVPASPSDILADFLTALGVREAAVPNDLAGRSALFRTATAGRRVLVVLDNARDDSQIQPLLPGSPECAVVVTSRAALNSVPSVLHVALDVFSEREALGLLDAVIGRDRRSAQSVQAGMLVEACGRLPLAVRIAAARLAADPDRPIADLVRHLADDGLGALRTGDVEIEQVFAVGYRLLPPPLATAFRMLSWVEPDIGLAAAAVVLGLTEDHAERLAEALVDQALVESVGAGRYRYHDLVRAFARRASLRTGEHERAAAHERLLTLLLGCARTAFALAVPGDPVADVFSAPPLRPSAAPGFADPADARRWARAEIPGAVALAAAVATVPALTAAALRAAVDLLIALTPLGLGALGGRAEEAARLLVTAALACGDRTAEGRSRFLLGTILLGRARLDEADAQARLAARACREAGDRAVLRQALNDQGLIAQAEGRHEEAIAAFDEAAAIARQLGHHSGEVASSANAALSRIRSGDAAGAASACRRILATPGAAADTAMTAYVHYVLGLAYQESARLDDAAAHLRACVDGASLTGDLDRESAARSRLAEVLRLLGRADEAVHQAQRALDLAHEGGRQRERALAHLVLAHALTAHGDHDAARDHEASARLLLGRLGPRATADAEPLLTALATAGETLTARWQE
ncbi:BTAD domain-containing putative transcriptional regulator [Streptomyces sp. SP17BM10]|uniref:AfsR/SARP family transcriptional regulator n=1 Tax=Streptomyces sp. SP17BM10 TaxID=3002530 RepID=UPI002E77DFF0|nr:BTAD domain-containing putative transcriptional regulator [Streptomyces sp. SP17BM10]MEE1782452.1 BTAD domain-containing putative transcriptional regulator [Streptomyces sp. SP17BM10]